MSTGLNILGFINGPKTRDPISDLQSQLPNLFKFMTVNITYVAEYLHSYLETGRAMSASRGTDRSPSIAPY